MAPAKKLTKRYFYAYLLNIIFIHYFRQVKMQEKKEESKTKKK